MDPEIIWNGAPDLEGLLYPVSKLRLLPGNYNAGDVAVVAKSYEKFGQRKAIVCRHEENGDEIVIAGNTQLQASRDRLGWTHIAVSWADDLDDANAIGYAVADNHAAELAKVDHDKLIKFLEPIRDTDVFEATGYTEINLREILEKAQQSDADIVKNIQESIPEIEDEIPPPIRDIGRPVVQYAIIFDNEDQQQRWFAFLRWLKRENPDHDTVAGRLDEFLRDEVPLDPS
jgi:hypothetical protein